MIEKKSPLTIQISIQTIAKTVGILILLWFLYEIRQIITILFISLMVNAAIDHWVDRLEEKKVPRVLAVTIIFSIICAFIIGSIVLIIPAMFTEISEFANNLPQYSQNIEILSQKYLQTTISLPNIAQYFENITITTITSILTSISNAFVFLGTLLLIFVITFYLTLEENAIKRSIIHFVPKDKQQNSLELFDKVRIRIGNWLQGQLLLSCIVGLLAFTALSLLDVKYALMLAFIAALGEFIPYIGSMLAGILAVFVAFSTSPISALIVFIVYIIIQQVENHILVPKIMQKIVGLNPIMSICALLIGIKIGGVFGGIIALPTATTINVIINHILKKEE